MALSHISEAFPAAAPPRPKTLDDLITELEERESLENPDAVVPMSALRLTSDGTLIVPTLGSFGFTDWSKQQLAQIVGVRWNRWFARMSADEQATEVNQRLRASPDRLRVRTTRIGTTDDDGTVQALVSPTFTPLADTKVLRLLHVALRPVESELTVLRSAVTDRSACFVIGVGRPFRPGDDHEIGDVWGSLTVRNSGVGYAAALIIASFQRLLCKNGMAAPIPGAVLLRRSHRAFDLEKVRAVLVERFRELPAKFAAGARTLVSSRREEVTDPNPAFEAILRAARLPLRLLSALELAYRAEPRLRGTAFGISQAVTRAAQNATPEERFLLERAAGEYLTHFSPADDRRGNEATEGEPS